MPDRPETVSREQWISARKALLTREKELTRLSDQLAADRQQLPWVRVEKGYAFDTPGGRRTLADLFGGRSQLITYHHMWHPGQEWQCPGCTGFTSQFWMQTWLTHALRWSKFIDWSPLWIDFRWR